MVKIEKRAISSDAKDKRREAIALAALEEFYLNGFKATKMEDIARRVNVSKGTLYLYFKSKEQVFIAAIELVAQPRMSMIQQVLVSAPGVAAGINSILDLAPKIIQHSAMPKLMKVLISDAFIFPDIVKDYREQVIDQGVNGLIAFLEKGKQQGEVQFENAEMMARLIIAPMIFSGIWTVVFDSACQTQLDLNALFTQHKKNIFTALGLTL